MNCGIPPSLPLSVMIWRGDTKVGSSVSYMCVEGFHNVREGDTSVCDSEGIWSLPDFLCQGIFLHLYFLLTCFLPLFREWVILKKWCNFCLCQVKSSHIYLYSTLNCFKVINKKITTLLFITYEIKPISAEKQL